MYINEDDYNINIRIIVLSDPVDLAMTAVYDYGVWAIKDWKNGIVALTYTGQPNAKLCLDYLVSLDGLPKKYKHFIAHPHLYVATQQKEIDDDFQLRYFLHQLDGIIVISHEASANKIRSKLNSRIEFHLQETCQKDVPVLCMTEKDDLGKVVNSLVLKMPIPQVLEENHSSQEQG